MAGLDRLTPQDLYVEEFRNETPDVRDFDCGNEGLNEFLRTGEVLDYHKDHLGKTWLVRTLRDGELVAYYTTSSDSLRVEHARRMPSIRPEYRVKYWPATLIGRLAVDNHWKGRGIGTILVNKIAADALSATQANRLLILNAEQGSVGFYESMGFIGRDHRMNRGRDKPLLYLDLLVLAAALDIDVDASEPITKRL